MPIATALLPLRVTVEAYIGSGSHGARYATAVTSVPARFVGRRRAVRTTTGTDVISSGSFVFRPDVTVPAESRITNGTDTYTVLDTAPAGELRRPHSIEVLVEGPR